MSNDLFNNEPAKAFAAMQSEQILHSMYPEEGDFIISPCGPIGSWIKVSIKGGGTTIFKGEENEDEARAYIRDRMTRDNFYPTVWMESDHGNLETVDIWKEGRDKYEVL